MTLQELIKAVDQLSPQERAELHAYLDPRKAQTRPAPALSPDERIRQLDEAAKAIREGFTDAEWEEVEQAMNAEYIEPWDESEWQD